LDEESRRFGEDPSEVALPRVEPELGDEFGVDASVSSTHALHFDESTVDQLESLLRFGSQRVEVFGGHESRQVHLSTVLLSRVACGIDRIGGVGAAS
jgi:hypothetical protein